MVGRKPVTEPRVRFMHEYMTETTYVFQSVKQRRTPRQSIPTADSWRFSPLRRVRQSVRSSSVKYRVDSGRLGMNSATQIASNTEGQPSIRKRIRHVAIGECLIEFTPKAIRPPKAPASAPAEMNRPMRLARSSLVYQYERLEWSQYDSLIELFVVRTH